MNASGLVRAGAWAVGSLVAFAAVAYLVLVVANWNDEPPSADAERLAAMTRERPVLSDRENAYVHALGLAAPPAADPLALGSERRAWLESVQPSTTGVGDFALPGEETDYRATRRTDVAALAAACIEASGCLAALDANPDALGHWLASEQWLLERYRRMLAVEGWREAIPHDIRVPVAGLHHAVEIQKLYLLDVRRNALAQDAATVRELLERDFEFWRRVLASSDTVISKMVAVAAVKRNLALGGLALRVLPPDRIEAALPASWRQPLTVDERSLARPLAGEWQLTRSSLSAIGWGGEHTPGASPRLVDRLLLRATFQAQATANLAAARMVRLASLSELPYPALGNTVGRMLESQDETAVPFRLYNPAGSILHAIPVESAYASYIARVSDLEGLRRATLLAATLRGPSVQRDDIAAAVRASPLRSPYDDAPFGWDPDAGSVLFRGLEPGERGRYEVLVRQEASMTP